MPKAVLKRLDFINKKCLSKFGTKFSRNTLKKPQYRCLWHPKYSQQPAVNKKPGFSFKLAIESTKAVTSNIIATIELFLQYKKARQRHDKDKNM